MTGSRPAHEEILKSVDVYYSSKIQVHGVTAKGVDWSTEDSQILRFEQLSKVIERGSQYTVNDLGCGYGAYFDYLTARADRFSYIGIDVSAAMIGAASKRLALQTNAALVCSNTLPGIADYTVASGIFNVRLDHTESEWREYFFATLETMNAQSLKGFAFNCLTSYSDPEKMRADLFYPNPCQVFDHCKTKFSRNVALLHDYGLYEFTILVRKTT